MLISLHLPKTAGSSFGSSLRKHFGADYFRDYGDYPIRTDRGWRELRAARDNLFPSHPLPANTRCIHGHFLPIKYSRLAGRRKALYVTWMRHPVDRLASHYYYWMRTSERGLDNAFKQSVLREQWSLEKFCLCPRLRNFYHQYFWAFDPARFDFIGITERYDRDFVRFSELYLGGNQAMEFVNANPGRVGREYPLDARLRARIEQHHSRDMELYRWAVARGAQ